MDANQPGEPRQRSDRIIDRLLADFDARHTTLINRAVQFLAVPLLLWSGFAVLKSLPVPAALAIVPGLDWSLLALLAIGLFYAALSWRLGAAMAAVSLVLLMIAAYYAHDDALPLWQPAIVFLGLGALLWLVGRRVEGRPRHLREVFLDLLMAPAWVLAQVLRLTRIGY